MLLLLRLMAQKLLVDIEMERLKFGEYQNYPMYSSSPDPTKFIVAKSSPSQR
jgi:hypothetical protein